MRRPVPPRSVPCSRDDHDRCPHRTVLEAGFPWRPRPQPQWTVWLCDCDCHAGCPLAGRRSVRQDLWRQSCTCPGSVWLKESMARREDEQRRTAEVMADVDVTDHPSAAELERRIRAAALAHGEPLPPFGLTAISRLASAGNAPRGTRRIRLLGLAAGAVVRAVRWTRQPAPEDTDVHNRQQLRRMYRVAGVLAALSGLLTGAAVASSGWRRVPCVLLATLSGLASLWTTAIATAVAQVARLAAERRES